MTPRDRRPEAERGPVDWGTTRPAQRRPGGPRGRARSDQDASSHDGAGPDPVTPTAAGPGGPAVSGGSSGPDWGVGRGRAGRPSRPQDGPDWGVGRARPGHGPGRPGRAGPASPWPAAARKQRLVGVLFALIGLALATVSAMNLAHNAEAGRLWVPPWLVAVLGGAGLVAAAGYLAWAGGTPVRQEAQRWRPSVVDAAAGLTTGTVEVHDPQRLLAAGSGPQAPGLPGGGAAPGCGAEESGDRTAPGADGPGSATGSATGSGPADGAAQESVMDSGPRPLMGASTVDQSVHAPAGVAGAVGGFLLAGAVVCAVIALVLGPAWLIATGALALGGVVSIHLAKDWLGAI